MLKHHLVDSQTQQEILSRYDVITKQNYFSHNKYIIILQDGLAMGAPSSGIIAPGTPAPGTPDTQTTHHQLLSICRRYFPNLPL